LFSSLARDVRQLTLRQVHLWGEREQVQEALRQLRDLDISMKATKWAKNPAYDGRKETRQDLKEREEEQTSRVKLLAESQEFPFDVSIPSFDIPSADYSLRAVPLHLAEEL
jgi:hypothetical protein